MSPKKLLCSSKLTKLNAIITWTRFNQQLAAGQLTTTSTTTTTTTTTTATQENDCFNKNQPEATLKKHAFTAVSHKRTTQTKKDQQRAYTQQQILRTMSIMSTNAPSAVFNGLVDRFHGITIDSKLEYKENDNFVDKLEKSLAHWQATKKRAIWFRVHTEQADWVPYLAKAGFNFHHAQVGKVMMYRWLPTDETSNLPHYAHTLIGVGGVVINENNEVLVVTDRFAMIPNSWKLPGGYVEPHENFIEAAQREVREETGIDTEFKSLISLRHSHSGSFGCSDLYIVVGLKAKNLDFTRCEREISRLQWMPITDYLVHPQVHETNRHFVRTYLDYMERGLQITCEHRVHEVLKRDYSIYFVTP